MSLNRVWTIFYDNIDLLLSGLWVTVHISLIAFAISLVVGLVLCLGAISRMRAVRWPAILIVEFCRNTPILVQLVWVHFAWPEILGVTLSPWQSAVTALALQSSGYLAEEFRAGIEFDRPRSGRSVAIAWHDVFATDVPHCRATSGHSRLAGHPESIRHLL